MEQKQRTLTASGSGSANLLATTVSTPVSVIGEPDPGTTPSLSCSFLSLSTSHRHDHHPTPLRGVYVTIQNQLFKALCDTGADVSFIDPIVTAHFKIATHPAAGVVSFAARDTKASRLGITDPI